MGFGVHDSPPFRLPRFSPRLRASVVKVPPRNIARRQAPNVYPYDSNPQRLASPCTSYHRRSKTYNGCVSGIRLAGQARRNERMKGTNMRYMSALAVAVLALVFGTATPSVAQPGGSYQQTCRNIGVRGSTLYAECQNTGGGWQSTQLRD